MQERSFSRSHAKTIPLPNLIQVQLDSYKWFLEKGFQELLDDFSPVEDYSGEHLKFFFLAFHLEEPEASEEVCRQKNLTYESPLRVKTRLLNVGTKEIKEQDVYFGHIPLVSSRGTFIINGIERVMVSQLLRSPGVYFRGDQKGGQNLFRAEIIPGRGAWIEFETSEEGVIFAAAFASASLLCCTTTWLLPPLALSKIFSSKSNAKKRSLSRFNPTIKSPLFVARVDLPSRFLATSCQAGRNML